MKIIPAIDIINAKVVRLTEGHYDQMKVYSESAVDLAMHYEQSGFKYLHLVDLDAAKEKTLVNFEIVKNIARQTNLQIDYGGGINNDADLQALFDIGVDRVNVGSMAVLDPAKFTKWIEVFGAERFILSADCLNGFVSINAWQDQTEMDIVGFLAYWRREGINCAAVTDIACDGRLEGPSFELYRGIIAQSDIELIASGGVSSIEDVANLKSLGCHGAIIGKALLEGRVSPENLLNYA